MGNMAKYTAAEIGGLLRHNSREVESGNYKNKDIDPERTKYNYSILDREIPYGMPVWKESLNYYRERKENLYSYARDDLKVLAEWIFPLPKEIWNMSEAINRGEYYPSGLQEVQMKEFFQAVHDFAAERYGIENVIQTSVHFDEGREAQTVDRWGNPQFDNNGNPVTEFRYGQPHISIDFIPVMKRGDVYVKSYDMKTGDIKRTATTKIKDGYEEKICANERLNRYELHTFHTDLQGYLIDHGIKGNILNGSTRDGNWTVEQLKSGMKAEYERLKELERQQLIQNDASGRWL